MSDQPHKASQGYRDLIAWQKAMVLAKAVYHLTARFPNEEKLGLISQMRRAAISVPSNLAEGQARRTRGEFVQFISHTEGSAAELDTQLMLSVELGYCTKSEATDADGLIQELRKMLNSLRRAVSNS